MHQAFEFCVGRLIFVTRPESINAVEDQRQDYRESDHANDRVRDAAMMM